jgi:hypothetical protein
MHDFNLLLKFRLAGDDQFQIKEAARIEVGGCGGLTVYNGQNGSGEKISIDQLESFSLLSVGVASGTAPSHWQSAFRS